MFAVNFVLGKLFSIAFEMEMAAFIRSLTGTSLDWKSYKIFRHGCLASGKP